MRDILIYGLAGGVLVAALKIAEYRFLVVDPSTGLYGALIAVLFAALGIWLGRTLHAGTPAPAATPAAADPARARDFSITPRELEILGLIADGLSNREIAARLFVSENTVKTHSSRLFDKLGAKRRTQAVQIGKAERLIP